VIFLQHTLQGQEKDYDSSDHRSTSKDDMEIFLKIIHGRPLVRATPNLPAYNSLECNSSKRIIYNNVTSCTL
jgi:hypothetical protein